MYVKELRSILKQYDEEKAKKLVVEIYKSIPKKVREEKNIDLLIEDVDKFLVDKKNPIKTIGVEKAKKIIKDANNFTVSASMGFYASPNKYVSKKVRMAWRNEVKRHIKNLNLILPTSTYGDEATVVLAEIYDLLNIAKYETIFSTNDVFNAIKMDRDYIFDLIVSRVFYKEVTDEKVAFVTDVCFAYSVRNIKVKYFLTDIIKSKIKTQDEVAVVLDGLAMLQKDDEKILNEQLSKKSSKSTLEVDYLIGKKKDVAELQIYFYAKAGEIDKATKVYMKYFGTSSKYVYILLNMYKQLDLKKEWLATYKSIKNKSKIYEYIDEENKFPRYVVIDAKTIDDRIKKGDYPYLNGVTPKI